MSKPQAAKTKSPWRPMSKAPKDGTTILVTETPNGEAWNVVAACWMAEGSGEGGRMKPDERGRYPDNTEAGRWWGITPARWSPSEGPLYVRWRALAITPVCWMPMPEPDSEKSLRRRMASASKHL